MAAGPQPGRGAVITWRDVLDAARAEVADGLEGWRIVEEASGWDRARLTLNLGRAAPARARWHAASMATRRAVGEPLQYVLGRWGFRGLDLLVDRRVLIPRPETEVVAGVAVDELRRLATVAARRAGGSVAVELGTGSGAIALAVATEVPDAVVWATDLSAPALAVARANLAGSGSRVGPRVRLVTGSWYEPLPADLRGRVDLIVSNPPYVAECEPLPPHVAGWEPREALVAGPTGMEGIVAVIDGAPGWLARPGSVVVELAPHQAEAAAVVARRSGAGEVRVMPDLAGRSRVLLARFAR